jgi:hypothetical protein
MSISGRCDLHIFLVHDEVDGLRCVGTVRAGSVRVRGRVGIPAGEGEGPVVSEAQHAEGEVLTGALRALCAALGVDRQQGGRTSAS